MDFPLIIAGLGRCGTSLSMQMLERAGLPVVGEYPAYEGEHNYHFSITQRHIEDAAGKALKIIDPHILVEERGVDFSDCRVVYLTRDLEQQARSQIKMATMLPFPAGMQSGRRQIRAMKGGLMRDNRHARRAFGDCPRIDMTFEYMLLEPEKYLERVAEFAGITLDCAEGAKARVPRAPKCFDGFLEGALIAEARLA